MIATTQIRSRFRSFAGRTTRHLLAAALLLLLCSNPLAAQDAPDTVTIKLPYDGPEMRFKAVHLGIDGENFFASRKVTLGSREENSGYKEPLGEMLLAGSFVGKRNGKSDWLYYLGETEVSRRQWNSVMRWMNTQKGKSLSAEDSDNPLLPQTGATIAEIYRFIEGLNAWMLQEQSSRLPRLGNAKAFCRLPTEAEWAFAARGGIEVNQTVFDRPHPYGDKLGEHEWHRGNTNSKVRKCGSKDILPNPVGLKDMLGNVEELTVSLFSPEYQQGRFGQFVIRGNNYSDSAADFNASHRTEFASHNQNGEVRHPSKVGFRLALSTAITSTGKSSADLDREFGEHLQSRPSARPGLVGKSSPAEQAEEDNIHYLQEQLERIKADKKRLGKEISRLEKLRNNDKKQCAETAHINKELGNAKQRLEAEISELQKQLSERPKTDELYARQQELKKANSEISRLQEKLRELAQATDRVGSAPSPMEDTKNQEKIKELEQRLAAAPDPKKLQEVEQQLADLKEQNRLLAAKAKDLELSEQQKRQKVFVSDTRLAELSQELQRKEEQLADLGRRQQLYEHEVTKNAARVRTVEKRYLEALMRQASANAYIGWRILKKRDAYLRGTGRNASDKKAQEALAEASQMINDYWHLVIQIADETKAEFFPEVKQKVHVWLRDQEKTGGSVEQRKALNLIERHLTAVRAGKRLRPDDLISSFLTQPEFR